MLRLLGVSPLGRTGLLAAKALSVLAVLVVQVVVVAVVAVGLGWDPDLAGVPAAVVSVLLGTWAFVALALLLAGTVRAEAVLALANLVWVALLALGGVVVARTELPAGLAGVVRWLPSAALGDAVRAALVDGAASPAAWAVLLVLGRRSPPRWPAGCSAGATEPPARGRPRPPRPRARRPRPTRRSPTPTPTPSSTAYPRVAGHSSHWRERTLPRAARAARSHDVGAPREQQGRPPRGRGPGGRRRRPSPVAGGRQQHPPQAPPPRVPQHGTSQPARARGDHEGPPGEPTHPSRGQP